MNRATKQSAPHQAHFVWERFDLSTVEGIALALMHYGFVCFYRVSAGYCHETGRWIMRGSQATYCREFSNAWDTAEAILAVGTGRHAADQRTKEAEAEATAASRAHWMFVCDAWLEQDRLEHDPEAMAQALARKAAMQARTRARIRSRLQGSEQP